MTTYTRRILMALIDIILVNIALYLAMLIQFEGVIPVKYINIYLHSFILMTIIKILIYHTFRLYKSLWQYASVTELIQIFIASLAGTGASILLGWITEMMYPNSVYVISWLLTFILLGGSRLSYRILRRLKRAVRHQDHDYNRVMIIGAGEAGSMVIKELRSHAELKARPVVVIDDDKWKHKASIHGIPIRGNRNRIIELAKKYSVDEIIIAIPSAKKKEISDILNICKKTGCRLKTLPGVYEIINEKVSIKHIRDASIEDLLGREEVELHTGGIAGYLTDEIIMVTGGGGSIGSELCRQIVKYDPKKLLIFDISENGAYELQNELNHTYKKEINIEILIGSIRDKDRLKQVFEAYKPGVVFHAAAHKHVPLMEQNPAEAVKNNVLGTLNVAQCADKYGAKRFVLISTDKAVNPTNIMGATKRIAEMIVQSMNKLSETEFVAVRFGNVLGSSGSVIPLFQKQIADGGPVTVTHPGITRFFMTIPEAAQLVIQAGAMAKGGEIFILDMGEPMKIDDLAKDLIRLSGLKPGVDIKIEYTGLRPGEKLYEELLLEEEGIMKTAHEKIHVGQPLGLSFNEVLLYVKSLENSMNEPDKLRECMAKILPAYTCSYGEAAAAGNK